MRIIPRSVHGILDYLVGLALIAAPWLFGFADRTAATGTPVILGAAAILYSALTDYEWGITRFISFRTHLVFDFVSGVILAASPWIFGFAQHVFWPHLGVGIFEVLASLLTREGPANRPLPPSAATATLPS